MRKNYKKTGMGMLLLALAAASLVGCGSGKQQTEDTEVVTTEAETTEEETTQEETTEAEMTEEETTQEQTTEEETTQEAAAALPIDHTLDFIFSSGAGGWSTNLTLQPDGSFTGTYHDSDMGDVGDENPNGVVYISTFSGKFSDITKVDEHTYSMKLASVKVEESGEWIEDGIKYIASAPYGIDGGSTFYFYLPDTPVAGLDEEFLNWRLGLFSEEDRSGDTLGHYGLYNEAEGDGLFVYD